jgi:uncharacterized protein (TIGR03083 family)
MIRRLDLSELADRSIAALRATHDDLAARVAGFSAADLAATSGSAEWHVAQVLSHLGSGAEIAHAVLTAGLAGEPIPDNEFNQRVWDRWNQLDRQAQATGFVESNERLVSTLEELPAETRENAAFTWFLPFPVGIEIFAGMRLSELAQHAWDVRVAFDPADAIPDDVAGTMLDVITGPVSFMVGFVGRGDEQAPTALEVRTTGPERRLGLTLGPQVAVGPAPDAADGTLTAPAEAVVRLIGGRLRPEHTPDGIELTGPVSLEQLRQTFPGF